MRARWLPLAVALAAAFPALAVAAGAEDVARSRSRAKAPAAKKEKKRPKPSPRPPPAADDDEVPLPEDFRLAPEDGAPPGGPGERGSPGAARGADSGGEPGHRPQGAGTSHDAKRGTRASDAEREPGGKRGGRSADGARGAAGKRGGRSADGEPDSGGTRGARSSDGEPEPGGKRGPRPSDGDLDSGEPEPGGARGGRSVLPDGEPEALGPGDPRSSDGASGPADAPAASPAQGASPGDVVERIDISLDATPAVGGPPPPPPPASPGAVEEYGVHLGGWSKAAGTFYFERDRWADPAPLKVPFDRLRTDEQLYLRVRANKGKSFEAVISGYLAHFLLERDAKGAEDFDGFNGVDTHSEFEALLREAYLGFFWDKLDLRLGQQRVAWGRGDAFTPNDVLNAVDTRDPLLAEPEVRNVPTLLARLDAPLPFGTVQLVFSPFFTPNRVDAYGTNWAQVQRDAPVVQRALLSRYTNQVDESLHGQLQPLLAQSKLPEANLSEPSVGGRLVVSPGDFDLSLYYHYGYAGTARTLVNGPTYERLAVVDFTVASNAQLNQALNEGGEQLFTTSYVRRHHLGLDGQLVLGRFSLRGDAAYDSRLVYTRRKDFAGETYPTFQGVLAVDYDTGAVGKVVLFEASYQRLINAPPDGDLLLVHEENVALAALLRWTFFEGSRVQLELEGRATVGVVPFSYVVRPQLGLKVGDFAARAGLILVDGSSGSLGHYYRRNDGVYLLLRYAY